MAGSIQKRVLSALLVALRPIARALLRSGIGYKEFAEVSKLAFVQIASEEYGIRGRPTNISRVSVITGVSRKEVGKIRSAHGDLVNEAVKGSPAGEVLHRWHTDPAYSDAKGMPNELCFDGIKHSFSSLVKGVAGDIPPGAMRAELRRVGAIEVTSSGQLKALKRHFVPVRVDDRLLHGLDTAVHSLADTIAFNVNPERQGHARFERVISSVNVDPAEFDSVRMATHEKLEKFSIDYDDFLSSREEPGHIETPAGEIGIGIYYFQKGG